MKKWNLKKKFTKTKSKLSFSMQYQYIYIKVNSHILDLMIKRYDTRYRYLSSVGTEFTVDGLPSKIKENAIVYCGYLKDDCSYKIIYIEYRLINKMIDIYNNWEKDRYNKLEKYRRDNSNKQHLPISRPIKTITINDMLYNGEEITKEPVFNMICKPAIININHSQIVN